MAEEPEELEILEEESAEVGTLFTSSVTGRNASAANEEQSSGVTCVNIVDQQWWRFLELIKFMEIPECD